MFRLLLIAGLLLLLYYFVRRAMLNRGEQGRWLGVGKGHAKGDHMVQDPVCRVFIPRGNAVREGFFPTSYSASDGWFRLQSDDTKYVCINVTNAVERCCRSGQWT